MILDSLANAALYRALGARIAAGLDYLAGFDPSTPDGKVELDGTDLYAAVQSYDTAPGAEKKWESHRRYLDIQYVASGTERILHAPTGLLAPRTEYNDQKDVLFYEDPDAASSLLLRPGDFVVFWPGDAHKPGLMAGAREAVKKVVVKVRL